MCCHFSVVISQKLPADGRMWFAVCELWYETFLNSKVKEQSIARSMLWHAITVFNELKEERHSEEEFVDHAITILKCRYIIIQDNRCVTHDLTIDWHLLKYIRLHHHQLNIVNGISMAFMHPVR